MIVQVLLYKQKLACLFSRLDRRIPKNRSGTDQDKTKDVSLERGGDI